MTTPKCKLCSRDTRKTEEICRRCRREHALSNPGKPLRPEVPCSRCANTSFVRCHSIRERAAENGDRRAVRSYIAPLAATYLLEVSENLWGTREISTPDTARPMGVFETYICRGC